MSDLLWNSTVLSSYLYCFYRSSSKGEEVEEGVGQEKKAKLTPETGREVELRLRNSSTDKEDKTIEDSEGKSESTRKASKTEETGDTVSSSAALSGLVAYSSDSSDSED